jgi:pentatricopeptide repeat protein
MVGNDSMKPNLVTFLSVLNACSDGGLVSMGQMLFTSMRDDFGLIQTLDHFTCMIDLLGRAGLIDEVIMTIEKMPFHPGIVAWHSVLGACKKWGNVDLGKHAFEYVLSLDDQSLAPYVFLSNIYSDRSITLEVFG